MKVPLFAVEKLAQEVRTASLDACARVFDGGRYILGPEVAAFEGEVAARFGDCHAIGVSNGTDALVCALTSVGVGRGDRVLTTPLTFFGTISAILRLGAVPVFCDVDERSMNLDVEARDTPGALAAVVPVHLFGRPVEIATLRRALPEVPVIEDAAQAWGANVAGTPVGVMGDLAAFSFFPTKPLGGCGDGGLVVTRDAALAARCRAVRSHGRTGEDGSFEYVGGNYRLDALQAALLRVRLARVDAWHERRKDNADHYLHALEDIDGLVLPMADTTTSISAWSVFSLRVPERRDALREHLSSCGVGTAVYYPRAAHLQQALGPHAGNPGQFPVAERLTRELLALPVGPELSSEDRDYVVTSVRSFFAQGRSVGGTSSNDATSNGGAEIHKLRFQ